MKRIVRFVITDVHMGLGHDGLNEVIRQHKKKNPLFAKVMTTEGGLVLFVNTAKNKIKLYGPEVEVLGYMRLPTGRSINRETVDLIPATFGGSIEYATSVKKALLTFTEKAGNSKRVSYADKSVLRSEYTA